MHEYSLVQALFDRIGESVRAHHAVAVNRVSVRIGELAGVEVPLFQTAYEVFRERTMCAHAPLVVQRVPARWTCPDGHGDIPRGSVLVCRTCGRPARLADGDDIVLDQLELEVP